MIKKIISLIIIILFCLFLYGRYMEITKLTTREYTITSEKIPNSFKDLKIVHFSDVLYNGENKKLNKLKELINNLNPDIIIFTGDLLNKNMDYTEDDYKDLENFMAGLKAELYKFAVIGDNDKNYLEKYKEILDNSKFELLDNSNFLLFYKDETPINIVGITDEYDMDKLVTTDVEYEYTIAITHYSDNINSIDNSKVDVMLAGNSLGGIVNIPYYGGVIKREGSNIYINDYYEVHNTKLYISNGVGYNKFEFRLFNPPSINVYRLNNN